MMFKRIGSLVMGSVYLLSTLLLGTEEVPFSFVEKVEAVYVQNDNTGLATIDLVGSLGGIQSLSSVDLVHDDTLGLITYQGTGTSTGGIVLSPVIPNSFSDWGNFEIDLAVGSYDDVSVSFYTCTGVLLGSPNLPIPGGVIDISTLAAGESCVEPHITMTDGLGPDTSIEEIRLTWDPLSFLSLDISVPATANACSLVTYDIQYSLSYVDDTDIVIYAPLPTAQSGSYTPSYGQNIDPVFDSATNSGQYTTGGISFTTVNGQTINVPANSVYWHFSNLSAGVTGILKYKVRIPCGTENGVIYDAQVFGDSANADPSQGSMVANQVVSLPAPQVDKSASNLISVGNTNYLYLPYSNLVTYSIKIGNGELGGGSEDIFNPTIVDDLSGIASVINSSCTGGDLSSRLSVTDGGIYNSGTQTITWSTPVLPNILELRSTYTVNYTIDYSGCNTNGLLFGNTANLTSNNVTGVGISDMHEITILEDVEPIGIFAKHIGNTSDLINEYTYEQPFSYFLQARNPGISRLEDVIMLDKIPDDQVLDGPITLPGGVVGDIFYTQTGASLPTNTPPSYVIATAASGSLGPDWSTTFDPNAKWVAIYIRCLSSPLFPGSSSYCPNAPSAVTVQIPVRMTEPAGFECMDTQRENIANFTYHKASNSITNLDSDIVTIPSPVLVQYPASRGIFHPIRPIIQVTNPINGPSIINADESATYQMDITNIGQDVSTSTLVTINIPQITKNGVLTYPSVQVLNAGGGLVTYNLPQSFTVDLGTLSPGQSRSIEFRLDQFEGVQDGSNIIISTVVDAEDPECGSFIFNANKSTTINGTSNLSAYKTRNLSFIGQGDEVEYSLFAINNGNVSATNGFVVDKVPADTDLLFVTTSGTSTNGVIYNCDACNVYFAPQLPQLPSDVNVVDSFEVSDIFAYFTLGNQTSPGVWQSTISNAQYIAVEIDNAQGFVPTSQLIKFGLTVRDNGNQPGETIRNYAGILSDQNLQSITNQVETTILDDPGLVVDIESSKDILESCEAYTWTVDYYSDAGTSNDATNISVTFPQGIIPTLVENEWNAFALSGGATLPGRYTLNTGVFLTGTLNLDGTYTYNLDVNGIRGANLNSLEGGTLYFSVAIPCGTSSNSSFEADVVGTFSNSQSIGVTSDNDPVFVQNADLEIIKNVSIFDPLPGEVVSYTLDLANLGAHEATNITIEDILQPGLCYQTGSVSIVNLGHTIGEPIIDPTPCNPLVSQTLSWSVGSGNSFIDTVGGTSGYLAGLSDHLFITYDVLVDGAIPQGTNLLNGVTVATTNPEDNYANNFDDEQVTTPFPDPTVNISGPPAVLPGEVFDYTIRYSNNNRACANNSYVIHTLPDVFPTGFPDGNSDVVITNIGVTTGVVYTYSGSQTPTPPTFDPLNPLTGGWTAWSVMGTDPVNYIVIANDYLCRDDGLLPVYITAQATDSATLNDLPVGLIKPYSVEIFTTDTDTDAGNNTDSINIAIPGIDLAIDIMGDPQGIFPGTVPGANQNYTVTYSNEGLQPSCDNFIEITFGSGFIPDSVLSNFTSVQLVNDFGIPVSPIDTGGNIITSPSALNVTMTNLGNNTYRFSLGTNFSNVCLPVGSEGTFNLFGSLDPSLADGETITTRALIGEDSSDIELVLSNNEDDTSVVVYRTDVYVVKTGYSYIGSPLSGSNTTTDQGHTINYTVQYDNIGNTNAEEVYLKEYIPEGTCYTVGTVEANLPQGSSVSYYDSGNNLVTPIADLNGVDCQVSRFELYFPVLSPFETSFLQAGTNWSTADIDPNNPVPFGQPQRLTLTGAGATQYIEMTTYEWFEEQFTSFGRADPGAGYMIDVDSDANNDFWVFAVGTSLYVYHLVDNEWVQYQQLTDSTLPAPSGGGRVRMFQPLDTTGNGKVDRIFFHRTDFVYSGAINQFVSSGGPGFFTGLPESTLVGKEGFGHLDYDGVPDIAFVRSFGGANRIYHLSGATWVTSGNLGSVNTRAGGLIDMDGDGLSDAVWMATSNNNHRFSTYSGGVWTTSPAFLGTSYLDWIAFGDLDGDGAIDHATSYGIGANRLWEFNGTSWVFDNLFFAGAGNSHGEFLDMNGDGKDDSFTTANYSNAPTVSEQNYLYLYNENSNNWTGLPRFGQRNSWQAEGVDLDNDDAIDGVFVMNGGYYDLNQPDYFYWRNIKHPEGGQVVSPLIDPTVLYPSNGNIASWNEAYFEFDTPLDSSISFSILDQFDVEIATGLTLLPDNTIDLSWLNVTTYPSIKLRADFSRSLSNPRIGPILNAWRVGFTMDSYLSPSFNFDVRVVNNNQTLVNLNSIDNLVTIETITPELNYNNNEDDEVHYFTKADVYTTKSVDFTATQSGEVLTYTVEYGNNGPNVAENVVLSDILPELLSLGGTSPAHDSFVGRTLSWNLGDLQPGETGAVVITGITTCSTSTVPAVQLTTYDGDLAPGVQIYNNLPGDACVWLGGTSSYSYCLFLDTVSSLPLCNQVGPNYENAIGETCIPQGTSNFAECGGGLPTGGHCITDYEPEIIPISSLAVEPLVQSTLLSNGFDIQGGLNTVATYDYEAGQTATFGAGCPMPDDLIVNRSLITSDTTETSYTNNNDQVTSIIGDYADVYTTVDCPIQSLLNSNITCDIEYGNLGNVMATGGDLVIDLDINFDYISLTGYVGGACSYSDNRVLSGSLPVGGSHSITCSGAQFTTVATGFSDMMSLSLYIPNNPNLVALPALGNNGVLLNVNSTITTLTQEITTANNTDFDQVIVDLPLSTIEGNVYVDVFQDQQFTPAQDIRLSNVTVCLTGTTFNGTTVGLSGSIVIPCSTTDSAGNYSFVGLYPGDYSVYYVDSTSFDPDHSSAGFIQSTQVGIGSLQGGTNNTTVNNISLGAGEDSEDNDFGLISTSCTTPLGLQIITPSNNTTVSTDDPITINGQLADLSASVTMNGSPVSLNINGTFTLTGALPSSTNTFVFEATNGDSACDEDVSLVISVNPGGGGGGGGGILPVFDSCPCGDYSGRLNDGLCTEPGQTYQEYLDKYCPTSPPPIDIPTFPSAPIVPTRTSSVSLILPPQIPVVGPSNTY